MIPFFGLNLQVPWQVLVEYNIWKKEQIKYCETKATDQDNKQILSESHEKLDKVRRHRYGKCILLGMSASSAMRIHIE